MILTALIRFNLITFVVILASFMLQQFFPAFSDLSQARILLVQICFLCAASCVSVSTMLILALVTGILWDANSALAPIISDPVIYPDPEDRLRFGYSIFLFGTMGFLMQGLRPLFLRGKWQISALLTGIATFLYLSSEYAIISFVAGEFQLSKSLIRFILYSSLLTMLTSPFVFALFFYLARIFNYSLHMESEISHKRRGHFS